MIKFRTSILAAALGLAALATTPAWAELILACSGSLCSGTLQTEGANTRLDYGVNVFGTFTIGPLTILGQLDDGTGGLMDVTNLDVAASGAGSIGLQFTETDLSEGAATQILMSFTGNLTGDMTATRTFYIDVTDGGKENMQLGQCTAGDCGKILSQLVSLNGEFSITEDIELTAGAGCTANTQCKLSSDDDFSVVPEPMSLSLLGTGLLGLGAMARRRRKAAKSA